MSNIISGITVTDFRGSTTSLSSFNLSLTPLTFTPVYGSYVGVPPLITWSFGDGDTSTSQSPVHVYKYPGLYKVTLEYYDQNKNQVVSTQTRNVSVFDYINDNFNVTLSTTFGNNTLSTTPGAIVGPLIITQTTPFYSTDNTIFYYVTGSNTINYFLAPENKFKHLSPYHCLFKRLTSTNNIVELQEIEKIQLNKTSLYTYIYNNTLVTTSITSPNTILAGFSGSGVYFYRDDYTTNRFNIIFNRGINDYSNTMNINLSGLVTVPVLSASLRPTGITITSTGIDGDSLPISSFNINKIKFANTKIPFVVKLKDISQNTCKWTKQVFPNTNWTYIISAGGLPSNYNSYTVTSLKNTITGFTPDFYRGCITFSNVIQPLSNIRLAVSAIDTNNFFNIITGVTQPFDVFPKDYYTVYKQNENFDAEGMFKSLRFSESLLDTDTFFEKFLGTIFGDTAPDIDALGKKVYERIGNFVDNTANVNTAEITSLIDQGKMLDMNIAPTGGFPVNSPNHIKRLINLFSINKNNLIGEQNKFAQNFDDKGFFTRDVYGKNLGSQINVKAPINLSTPYVVGFEKFSNVYTLLSAPFTNNFIISNYNTTWNWPINLPDNFTSEDLGRYYLFFTYIDTIDGTSVGNIIDFNTSNIPKTISYSELYGDSGVVENMLLNTLYISLSLTK